MEISKSFNFLEKENLIYQEWEELNCFQANDNKDTFSIIMPPPNATGQLHVGHACGLSIQDIMVRFKRMQGFSTWYIPGTDHAALATSSKVEGLYFKKEGKTRHDYGREKFLDLVNDYVKNSQNTIIKQTKVVGTSCDWRNIRYTMDETTSNNVLATFIKMYNDGLIYRAGRIVNWDPNMQSTVSTEEIEYKEEKSKFYYLKFGPVTIGTSRPETKFRDKIIVVHPEDKRYKHLIGTEFECEWIDGTIKAKIIADDCIDMNLGTGAMTITPAHSMIDYDLAIKHNLEIQKVIGLDGKILDSASKSCGGLSILDARKKVIDILEEKGLVEKIEENYMHNIALNERGGGVIEPQVMHQWWLNVNKEAVDYQGQKLSFKQILEKVIKEDQIEIIPKKFEATYFNWIENYQDWCLSRQIWFGHRIPAWYKDKEIKVQKDSPGEGWKQDEDTLDTWFSSAQWTYNTMEYPKMDLIKKFHPTSVLETGREILTIWVIRMIMMSTYNLGEIPFKQVFLHGMVVDKYGKKMSKSKDNGIDPLDVVAKYGADAVRLSLIIGMTPGQDTRMSEEKIASYRNFVTKVWNSVRYILLNVDTKYHQTVEITAQDIKSPADSWILCELNKLMQESTACMEKWHLSQTGTKLYNFLWNTLCNYYIEMSKTSQNPKVLIYVTQTILKMLQPFIPFVTQELWSLLGHKSQLMLEQWPEPIVDACQKQSNYNQDIILTIQAIRSLKQEMNLQNNKDVRVLINTQLKMQEAVAVMKKMTKLENIEIIDSKQYTKKGYIGKVVKKHIFIMLELPSDIDIQTEIQKAQKEINQTTKFIENAKTKLNNPKYVNSAPEHLVQETKDKLQELEHKLEQLQSKLIHLQNV
jgi:valyl-tRNA synthetase